MYIEFDICSNQKPFCISGADILCWSTDLFPKDPGSGKIVEWHQDATYVGMLVLPGLVV